MVTIMKSQTLNNIVPPRASTSSQVQVMGLRVCSHLEQILYPCRREEWGKCAPLIAPLNVYPRTPF